MAKKIKIVITGAESTGKTTLTKYLAKYYNSLYIKEYAREYVENLNRTYNYNDVVHIAKKQTELENEYLNKTDKILFVDTSLIITKVWFEVVFGKKPLWFKEKLIENFADFYLLCNNDLNWISDNVRENSGKMRQVLYETYKKNLEKYKLNYRIVAGKGNVRFKNAVKLVNTFLKNIE